MIDPDNDAEQNNGSQPTPPGMPRWVKISVALVAILVVMLVVIMALVGGEHGPGLHTGVGDSAGTSLAAVLASQ